MVLGLLLSGCFKDKAEEAIKNCTDTRWSKEVTELFDKEFYVGGVYSWDQPAENIFDETVLKLKRAGFKYTEVFEWAQSLKTAKIDDTNKEIIDHFIKMKNKTNKFQEDLLKLPLTDRLQNSNYELMFQGCEQQRKKASKTFDAKWKKAILVKVEFGENN